MCPSVPTQINSYMSKSRLLLETNDETNEFCLKWVPCIPGTMAQDALLLIRNLQRGNSGAKGLIYMPCKKLVIEVAAYPTEHLEAPR